MEQENPIILDACCDVDASKQRQKAISDMRSNISKLESDTIHFTVISEDGGWYIVCDELPLYIQGMCPHIPTEAVLVSHIESLIEEVCRVTDTTRELIYELSYKITLS